MNKSALIHAPRKKWQQICLWLGVILLAFTGGGMLASSIIFLQLPRHPLPLQKALNHISGYRVAFTRLSTGFNHAWQPFINFENLTLANYTTNHQWLKIKQIHLELSWASVWHLKPIFSTMLISGSQLNLKYDQHANLIINQEPISNLAQTSPNEADLETWLLQQQFVAVHNFQLTVLDPKQHAIAIKDLNCHVLSPLSDQHQFKLTAELANSHLALNLDFVGKRLFDIREWDRGQLIIHNIGRRGYLVDLVAKVNAGQLQSMVASLDSNQQQMHQLGIDSSIKDVRGSIALVRTATSNYKLNANDLTIKTPYGYLFRQAAIDGKLTLNQGGYLDILNVKLEDINSLIQWLNHKLQVKLSGVINHVHLTWQGSILDPQAPHLSAKFSQVALASDAAKVPSFNNLNGNLEAETESGQLQLNLQHSQFSYPAHLLHPLLISDFASTIHWQLESASKLKLNWDHTHLTTADLNLNSSGNYQQSTHQLQLKLNLVNLNLNQLYNYLPLNIGKDGINYAKNSFKHGEINNGQLRCSGDPRLWPFKHGGGSCSLSAELSNGAYQFLPQWKGLTGVQAKLQGLNQSFSLTIKRGQLDQLQLQQVKLNLADITQAEPILQLTGMLNGASSHYLDYAESSPLTAIIQNLKQQLQISGPALTTLNLNLPLTKPAALKLTGSVKITDNQVQLTQRPLSINAINGLFNFNQQGLTAMNLNATALDSQLQLTLPQPQLIQLQSAAFNFESVAGLAYPPLTKIIHGKAPLSLNYNLKTQQLGLSSNLQGLTIQAPQPLGKAEATISRLATKYNLPQQHGQIILNDSAILDVTLNQNFSPTQVKVGLGSLNYTLNHPLSVQTPLSLRIDLANFYAQEWAAFIQNLLPPSQDKKAPPPSHAPAQQTNPSPHGWWPVQVELYTKNLWIAQYNFESGMASIIAESKLVNANLSFKQLVGSLHYLPESNNLAANFAQLALAAAPHSTSPESGLAISYTPQPAVRSSKATNRQQLAVPTTTFTIGNLAIAGHSLGKFSGNLKQLGNSLFFNNLVLTNPAATTSINLVNHCFSCSPPNHAYVALHIKSLIHNFGDMLVTLNQGDMFKNGTGVLDLNFNWDGKLTDFKLQQLSASTNLYIQNGQLVHVNPGLFATLLGVINFSAINNLTNLEQFNFNSFFGKGFDFNTLTTNLSLSNGKLTIKHLAMQGSAANVKTFGNYSLESRTVDTYLTIEPRLSSTVATTAGIVTLNPIIGVFVYLGQKLIGDPVNKALSISYHITGDVNQPTLTRAKISKQLLQNFKSSLDFVTNPADLMLTTPQTIGNN